MNIANAVVTTWALPVIFLKASCRIGAIREFSVENPGFTWKLDEMGTKNMNVRSVYGFCSTVVPASIATR
jgi:hypothetical protein